MKHKWRYSIHWHTTECLSGETGIGELGLACNIAKVLANNTTPAYMSIILVDNELNKSFIVDGEGFKIFNNKATAA